MFRGGGNRLSLQKAAVKKTRPPLCLDILASSPEQANPEKEKKSLFTEWGVHLQLHIPKTCLSI